jgi:hypothetical protein
MSARRAALAAALACNPPASGEPAPAPPAAVDPPASTCEEPPAGTIAVLPPVSEDMPEGTCPWVLVKTNDELTARPLILHPGAGDRLERERALEAASSAARRRPVPVLPPADCRPCSYEGVVTALGPIVVAARPAADSELAAAAWIGAGMPPSPRVRARAAGVRAAVVRPTCPRGQHAPGPGLGPRPAPVRPRPRAHPRPAPPRRPHRRATARPRRRRRRLRGRRRRAAAPGSTCPSGHVRLRPRPARAAITCPRGHVPPVSTTAGTGRRRQRATRTAARACSAASPRPTSA